MSSPPLLHANPRSPGGLVALSYQAGGHAVVAFCGHLQPGNVPVFSDQLLAASDLGAHHLVLDLHLVRSIHPLAVDVLDMALRRATRRGRTIATAGAGPSVQPALETLYGRGLLIHKTVHEALNAA